MVKARGRLLARKGYVLSVLLVCAGVILFVQPAAAEDNPTNEWMEVRYKDGGQYYIGERHFNGLFYKVLYTGWCEENHRTPAPASREFDHGHIPTGIPFWDTDREPDVWVTEEMADLGWDHHLQGLGWTRVAGTHSTCAYNCHGYALGVTNVYMASGAYGVGRYRPDAGWEPITEPVAKCIESDSHSQIVWWIFTMGCQQNRVQTYRTKSDSSPIYEKTLAYPGEAGSNLYDK